MGNSAWGEVKVKGTVIDSRHVTGATWLVFFGLEAERVNINAGSWDVSVVLVWLDKIEVATITFREAIVAVKLDLASEDRVHATVKERSASGVDKAVPTGNTKRFVVASPW